MRKLLIALFITSLIYLIVWSIYKVGFNQGYQIGNKTSDKWFSEALEQPDIAIDRFKINIEACKPQLWISKPMLIGEKIYFPIGKTWRLKINCSYRSPDCWEELGP